MKRRQPEYDDLPHSGQRPPLHPRKVPDVLAGIVRAVAGVAVGVQDHADASLIGANRPDKRLLVEPCFVDQFYSLNRNGKSWRQSKRMISILCYGFTYGISSIGTLRK